MNLSLPMLAAAIGPPLLLVLFFRSLARPRPSWWFVAGLFLLGAVSPSIQAPLTTWLESASTRVSNPYLAGLSDAFFPAALPEESCRFVVVLLAVLLARGSVEPRSGLVFGLIAGAGFAATEAALGVLGGESLPMVAVGRTLGAVGHCCSGAIIGYFLALARSSPRHRVANVCLAFAGPTLLHTLYDFAILTEVPGAAESEAGDELPPWPSIVLMLLSLLVFLTEVIWTVVLIRRSRLARLGGSTADLQPGSVSEAPAAS